MEFLRSVKDFYNDLNSATLSGAIDVIVVRAPDGSLHGSPFHVRFGKLNVLRTKERVVSIRVNGERVPLKMKLGAAGECFFVQEEKPRLAGDIVCSPIPSRSASHRSRLSTRNGGTSTTDGTEQSEGQSETKTKDNVGKEEEQQNGGTDSGLGSGPGSGSLSPQEMADTFSHESSPKLARPVPLATAIAAATATTTTTTTVDIAVAGSVRNIVPSSPLQPISGVRSDTSSPVSSEVDSTPTASPVRPLPPLRVDSTDTIAEWDWGALPMHVRRDGGAVADSRVGGPPQLPWISSLARSLHASASPGAGLLRPGGGIGASEGVYLRDLDPQLRDIEPDNISFHSTNEELLLDHSGDHSPAILHHHHHHSSRGPSIAATPQTYSPEPGGGGEGYSGSTSSSAAASRNMPISLSRSTTSSPSLVNFDALQQHQQQLLSASAPGGLTVSPQPQSMFAHDTMGMALQPPSPSHGGIEVSLCGGLSQDASLAELEASFNKHAVSFDAFQSNPMILSHPNLVFRIHGKYLNWAAAAPIVMSFVLYGRALPPAVVEDVLEEHIPKTAKRGWSRWFWSSGSGGGGGGGGVKGGHRVKLVSESDSIDTVVPPAGGGRGGAGGGDTATVADGRGLGSRGDGSASAADDIAINVDDGGGSIAGAEALSSTVGQSTAGAAGAKAVSAMAGVVAADANVFVDRTGDSTAGGGKSASSSSRRRSSSTSSTSSQRSNSASPSGQREYYKALRLTSEQLKELPLKEGRNIIEFSVISKMQGRAKVQCLCYLWPHDAKIVVSDIDGTITKSDVLGHLAQHTGLDWTHAGVAKLFSHVADNGYRVVYLSARNIAYAGATRGYIEGVRQDGVGLPDGPILLAPTSLLRSLHNEVILKVSDRFKSACLNDLLRLFPPGAAYYAGFGNRESDINAYKAVGIRPSRIFIINPASEVLIPTSAYRSSYKHLEDIADELFPPLQRPMAEGLVPTDTTFGAFEFWRSEPVQLSEEDFDVVFKS